MRCSFIVTLATFVLTATAFSQEQILLQPITLKDSRQPLIVYKCPGGNYTFTIGNRRPKCELGAYQLDTLMKFDDFMSKVGKYVYAENPLNKTSDVEKDILSKQLSIDDAFYFELEEHFKAIKTAIKKASVPPAPVKPPATKDAKKKSSAESASLSEEEPSDETAETDDGSKSDSSDISTNITYLNAANFDFSGSNLSTKYLGLLNIFAPNSIYKRWGFNAGIEKVNYSANSDTNTYVNAYQNVLINPNDYNSSLYPSPGYRNGAPYLRQYNRYTLAQSNTQWSFYLQPLFRLSGESLVGSKDTREDKRVGIYAHAHLELLISKYSRTVNIRNLRQDTLAYVAGSRQALDLESQNPIVSDYTLLNGYFGVGFTFFLDPFQNLNSRFFCQATTGITTDYPNATSTDLSSTDITNILTVGRDRQVRFIPIEPMSGFRGFYLLKVHFNQTLSKTSQLVVGTEIRGLFPRFSPVYATFVGLKLDLNAVAGLISK